MKSLKSQDILDSLKADFTQLLEKSLVADLTPGAITVGEVLRVDKDGLQVDVGGKSEGFVPLREIPGCYNAEDLKTHFKVGEVREFYILNEKDDDTVYYQLSLRRVEAVKNWDQLKQLEERQETVQVKVVGATKGGVLVSVLDLKGFIPASQLRVPKTLMELVGDVLPAKILEVDKDKNKLILSNRAAVFEEKAAMRQKTLSRLNEGDIVEGAVVKITDFGAFVDIDGIDGLLPLSEISWRRIQHPSELLTLGQRLQVSVLTVDQKLQRISLSKKRLEADPWNDVVSQLTPNDVVLGRVSKMLSSGVLVELLPGVEAYCAFIPNGKYFHLHTGYHFQIVSISASERRITLTYVEDAPEEVVEAVETVEAAE